MVYVVLADGFEEIEALTPVDILRRAGVAVTTLGVTGKTVKGAHGICVEADMPVQDANPEEMTMLILPGGPGHELLDASNEVHGLINEATARGLFVAAICAAPSVLGKKHLLNGKKAVCFPGYEKYLYGAEICTDPVVQDGKFITAKGAGAAAEFGFALVSLLKGQESADKLKGMMQYS